MTTGQRIKAARKQVGMTQAELADKLGISYVGISQWENSMRKPKIESLERIAAALGVSLEALTGIPDSVRAMGIDRIEITSRELLPAEFNEFERFIETLGYYTRLDGDNYRLHKGKSSVVITPEQLSALVRASKATVAALVQDLMETAQERPPANAPETASEGE